MHDYNEKRVVYYGRNDWAAGAFRERCLATLNDAGAITIRSINDAVESHQIKQTIEGIPELFDGQEIDDLLRRAKAVFSKACQFAFLELKEKGIELVYDQVELQYGDAFWQFVDACGAWREVGAPRFEEFLDDHPGCIGAVLQYKTPSLLYGDELGRVLLDNPRQSAETIVSRLASEAERQTPAYLPLNMSNSDIDVIMLRYIEGEAPNPNHLSILASWPSNVVGRYKPSPEVRVKAKREYRKSMKEAFQNGAGLKYGTGATIDMNQIACKGIQRKGSTLTHTFSGFWLKEHLDPATILNNLIYIFDFVDVQGVMEAPARQHETHGILGVLGMHIKGEYRTSIGFSTRSGLTYVETRAYAEFLEANGARLESAIEWFYNDYISEEFGIVGFSLALPVQEASWLDKCKAIGPEIERAVKAYSLYAKYGEIEGDYFPHESVKSFSTIPALAGKKYAVAGPDFDRYAHVLFSDQSLLAFLDGKKTNEPCFCDAIAKHFIVRDDYPEWAQAHIAELVKCGLISEGNEDGRLSPTERAAALKLIWERDALSLWRLGEADLVVVESLAEQKIISYCNMLFTPSEGAYLDYMFNDASFPNSQGLRNRYDHAHSSIEDSQADDIRDDYYKLLSLLVGITLKTNEELMRKTGCGGLDTLVDWPYYDKSVFHLAAELDLIHKENS